MTQVKHTPSAIPSGMVEVTKEIFFKALYADNRDIMPSVSQPYVTKWETRNRELWGWESTGWKSPFGEENIFAIYPTAIAKAEGGAA